MSRLDELIQELCPNGVEEKRLGDIATVSRGGNFQKKDYVEDGVPCIHYGQIYTQYGLFIDKTISFISKEKAKKQKFAVKNDVVMAVTSENIDDVCKCVAWLGDEAVAISGHTAIIHHTINPKYLVYYLHSTMFYKQKTKLAHGTKVIEVTPDKLLDITLPVPPLEVQSEIVRILDNFTELTAELTARKKQYEHYRNKLFSFNVLNCATVGNSLNNIVVMPLGEVGIFTRGSGLQKKDFTQTGVGCIHYGQIYTHYGTYANRTKTFVSQEFAKKARKAKHGDLIIATTSENDEDVCKAVAWLGDEDIAISSDACFYTHSLEPKYVAYYFQAEQFQKQKRGFITGTKVRRVNTSDLAKIKIPVPSIEEQRRIVSILDKFDMLTTSISEGLPKEIELRRKQYEYYRNQLLSFPDNKATD